MEFRFDVGPLLKAHIVRITSNLIPPGFTGDRRSALYVSIEISIKHQASPGVLFRSG